MPPKSYVKKLIEDELKSNRTDPGWQGKGVVIARTQFSLTTQQREEVQAVGTQYGCHTCRTRLEIDKDQPWVGDHIPPTELPHLTCLSIMPRAWGKERYLFPQCHQCSGKQSGVVRAMRAGSKQYADLTPIEKKLLGSGHRFREGTNCLESSGPRVTAEEGWAIQKLGNKHGCHSCSATVPTTVYHADHSFPQEFCTSYMEQVFADLGLPYPTHFDLRPQCPRCSGHQGGKIKKIADVAIEYAREDLHIMVYKFT